MMELTDRKEISVRFSEVDSMRIVWHGNYIKYFEDGRESFGIKYDLGYLEVYKHQVMIPLVRISCDFKRPLQYGDIAIIETRYIPTDSAKIVFEYTVFRKSDMEIMATGSSIQVFLTQTGELLLTAPEFYTGWKKHWGIIDE
ncbi:MAG: acyl-CoA thioesterase [Bacteroidales bacterium]|nr:acyl-CoA thioesterase [Bacteroidales bacterium]MDD4603264.1 acyl-CoA thioesterase [Bacteroidales bacterium]